VRPLVERALETLAENPDLAAALTAAPSEIRASIPIVFGASDFVSQSCTRDRRLFADLVSSADLLKRLTRAEFVARAPAIASATAAGAGADGSAAPLVSDADFMAALRR